MTTAKSCESLALIKVSYTRILYINTIYTAQSDSAAKEAAETVCATLDDRKLGKTFNRH